MPHDVQPVEEPAAEQVASCLPAWDTADLPEPRPMSWRHLAGFIGPGIVMMGIQIGGGEWLYGPEVTAKYGGALMWIATIAIVLQVFYNLECGRYALYCGEPIMTGFMRKAPGPMFWIGVVFFLNLAALIPGLSTHGAALLASLYLDHPPGPDDRWLVTALAFACLFLVAVPVLVGGKVYNTLQVIMTTKVFVVLTFCLVIGILFVSLQHWWDVFSGFGRFGNVPILNEEGKEDTVNAFAVFWNEGHWPLIALGNIATLGAFAGYAGGGGLANSTYSNFVRDKGWGMGARVGAIASAVGGRSISLSHLGKTFPLTADNLRRWRGWWKYVLLDQALVWGPGCFMGMALPALLSMQFAHHSELYDQKERLSWAQALITADGIRHAPQFSPGAAKLLWVVTLLVGMMVMFPSQMSIVEDFSRRWTDILWSGSRRIRERMRDDQVKYIYYTILFSYVLWTFVCAWIFTYYFNPKVMTDIIANMNNVAIGFTSLQLLWVNRTLLPPPLRPRWYQQLALIACGAFYLGLSALVFIAKVWPLLGWATK